MACELPHIPTRLHENGRPNIDHFNISEYLFRRCDPSEIENPFAKISLVDISVNRSGIAGSWLSQPEDVLYNTNPEKYGEVVKLDQSVAILEITELNAENQYHKSKTETRHLPKKEPETNTCDIKLKHKKEQCNYAHCTFEIYYDNIQVSFENYNQTIKRNSLLRTWCKNELAKMIVKEEVRINWLEEEIKMFNNVQN